jgi:hypothetical protein
MKLDAILSIPVPSPLREKVRMRGNLKDLCLSFILLTPTLSSRRGGLSLSVTA